jgi:hypothetical protein
LKQALQKEQFKQHGILLQNAQHVISFLWSLMNLGHAIYENAQFHVDYIFIEIKVGEVNRTHGSNYCRFYILTFWILKKNHSIVRIIIEKRPPSNEGNMHSNFPNTTNFHLKILNQVLIFIIFCFYFSSSHWNLQAFTWNFWPFTCDGISIFVTKKKNNYRISLLNMILNAKFGIYMHQTTIFRGGIR